MSLALVRYTPCWMAFSAVLVGGFVLGLGVENARADQFEKKSIRLGVLFDTDLGPDIPRTGYFIYFYVRNGEFFAFSSKESGLRMKYPRGVAGKSKKSSFISGSANSNGETLKATVVDGIWKVAFSVALRGNGCSASARATFMDGRNAHAKVHSCELSNITPASYYQ